MLIFFRPSENRISRSRSTFARSIVRDRKPINSLLIRLSAGPGIKKKERKKGGRKKKKMKNYNNNNKRKKLTEWFVLMSIRALSVRWSLSKLRNLKKGRREDFKFDSSSFALLENWKSAEGMIVSSWIKLLDCNRGLKVRNIRT